MTSCSDTAVVVAPLYYCGTFALTKKHIFIPPGIMVSPEKKKQKKAKKAKKVDPPGDRTDVNADDGTAIVPLDHHLPASST